MRLALRLFTRLAALATVLVASSGIAAACPSYNNPTVFGSANISANFQPDPWVRNVTAGGQVSLQGCGFSYPGFVVSRPDFRFFYSGTSPTGQLTIALEARSNVDTILFVNAPDGNWFHSDDNREVVNVLDGNSVYRAESLGTNSAITFTNPQQGQYDIWTGSYYRSSNNPAVLIVTELNY